RPPTCATRAPPLPPAVSPPTAPAGGGERFGAPPHARLVLVHAHGTGHYRVDGAPREWSGRWTGGRGRARHQCRCHRDSLRNVTHDWLLGYPRFDQTTSGRSENR